MDYLGVAGGFLIGVLGGIIPGVHTNTLAGIISQLQLSAETATVAIAAIAGAHAVFELFPAIFLSVPDSGSTITFLPGHRMLLQGQGLLALRIGAYAALASTAIAVLLYPVAVVAFPIAYSIVEPYIGLLVVLACTALIASERRMASVIKAAFVFLVSGALGFLALNATQISDPLFPLFCGLFAMAGILCSGGRETIPKQVQNEYPALDLATAVLAGVVFGMAANLLPGLGSPAQMAVFASIFLLLNEKRFLAFTASLTASQIIFSFAASASIGKERVGTVAQIVDIAGTMNTLQSLEYALIAFVCAAAATALLLMFAEKLSRATENVDLRGVNWVLFAYLAAVVFIVDGFTGLLIAATAAAIGTLPVLLRVRRTHLMGSLLATTLLYYSGFAPIVFSLVFRY